MKKIVGIGFALLLAAAAAAQTVPAGTALRVKLDNTLATFSSKSGDAFSGHVTEALTIDGQTIVPVGAVVQGRVTRVSEPRRIAGKPTIGILPQTLVLPTGEHFAIDATLVDTNLGHGTDVNEEGQFKGAGHDRRDLLEIAGGTGGGMLIGGLAAAGKGTLIGAAIGGTAAIAYWLSKRNSAVLPAGTELVMEVERPLAMTPPTTGQ